MTNDNGNEDDRIIFRPSKDQIKKIEILMGTGEYKTLSELYRQLFNLGIKEKMNG